MAVSENDLVVGPITPALGVTLISLDFFFEDESDIEVYKTGSEIPLVLAADYTTTGAGTDTGTVNLTVAADGVDDYSVYLSVPLARSTDLQLRGQFRSDPFNTEFDRVWQAMQGLRATIARKLGVGRTDNEPAPIMPTPNQVIGFDANGIETTFALVPFLTPGDEGVIYVTEALLLASTEASRGIGATWKGGAFRYTEVASGGDVTTAGGVALDILVSADGSYNVLAFGAVGDGVIDDSAAFQAAAAIAGPKTILIPPQTFYVPTPIVVTGDTTFIAHGATVKGGGFNSNLDLFTSGSGDDITVLGGKFTEARYAFYSDGIGSLLVDGAAFDDLVIGILLYGDDSTGRAVVINSKFSNLEIGFDVQSITIPEVLVDNNSFTNINFRTLTSRPAPLDKTIVSGFWWQEVLAMTADTNAIVTNNFVDGVAGPLIGEVGTENEVHGLGVALQSLAGSAFNSAVIMSGNTIRSVAGHSTLAIGDEGLVGRGQSVIMSSNILYDAGAGEGMLYAKGTEYHKITDNTVEMSSGNSKAAYVRGVISTGPNCDITNNKFIGLPIGIITRAVNGNYNGNEFYNVTNCLSMRLETGTNHVSTVANNNYIDPDCETFFVNETDDGSSATYGDFSFRGNQFYGGANLVNIKAATSLTVTDNVVDRKNPTGARELFNFRADKTIGITTISNNLFLDYDDGSGTGRLITIPADGSAPVLSGIPKLIFKGNYVGIGERSIFSGTRQFTDLIIFGNDFFCDIPLGVEAAVVTGHNVQSQNIGVDPMDALGSAAPTTGTWRVGVKIYDEAPAASGFIGWICITDGTFSSASDVTGDPDGATAVIAGLADTSDFFVGDYVTVSAGMPSAATPYRITGLTATTMILDTASTSAQTDVTIVTVDPTFKTFGVISA